MKKFIAGVATTFGVLYLLGYAREQGEQDAKKELVEMIETGCDVGELVKKFKGEA